MISNSNAKQETIDKALTLFDEGYACSQSVLLAFADRFKLDKTTAKLISSTFGGGMGRLRQKNASSTICHKVIADTTALLFDILVQTK